MSIRIKAESPLVAIWSAAACRRFPNGGLPPFTPQGQAPAVKSGGKPPHSILHAAATNVCQHQVKLLYNPVKSCQKRKAIPSVSISVYSVLKNRSNAFSVIPSFRHSLASFFAPLREKPEQLILLNPVKKAIPSLCVNLCVLCVKKP